MADEIKHGSTAVVNTSALVTDAALPNAYANAAGSVVANNTQLFTVTVDKKGRITQSVAASVNVQVLHLETLQHILTLLIKEFIYHPLLLQITT